MKQNKFLLTFLFLLTIILLNSFFSSRGTDQHRNRANKTESPSTLKVDKSPPNEILLLYVYAGTHSRALGNLKYFIENAVQENDGIDYYFILQQIEKKPIDEKEMPPLPSKNAHYVQHENKCFDFGTFGWFFQQYTEQNYLNQGKSTSSKDSLDPQGKKKLDLKKYKYFIFMNSSIRGPFFPPYFLQILSQSNLIKYYWYSIFIKRLNNKVKLVGCTISCETVPHVQTYFFATDYLGLSIIGKPGAHGATSAEGIFACYPTKDHVSINSELPISNRILNEGYLIDSMLTKYQTLNFSQPENRFCNKNLNPYKDKGLEGTSLEPFEVVFVKFNDLEFLKDARDKAALYQKWSEEVKNISRSL